MRVMATPPPPQSICFSGPTARLLHHLWPMRALRLPPWLCCFLCPGSSDLCPWPVGPQCTFPFPRLPDQEDPRAGAFKAPVPSVLAPWGCICGWMASPCHCAANSEDKDRAAFAQSCVSGSSTELQPSPSLSALSRVCAVPRTECTPGAWSEQLEGQAGRGTPKTSTNP